MKHTLSIVLLVASLPTGLSAMDALAETQSVPSAVPTVQDFEDLNQGDRRIDHSFRCDSASFNGKDVQVTSLKSCHLYLIPF